MVQGKVDSERSIEGGFQQLGQTLFEHSQIAPLQNAPDWHGIGNDAVTWYTNPQIVVMVTLWKAYGAASEYQLVLGIPMSSCRKKLAKEHQKM